MEPMLERERDRTGAAGATTERSSWSGIPTILAGGVLVALGLKRRSLSGILLAITGGWLCYRGLRGRQRRIDRSTRAGTTLDHDRDDAARTGSEPVVARSITISSPPEELVERWRDPETVSRMFDPFVEITAADPTVWRWRVTGPFGWHHAWRTELVESEPSTFLRWEAHEDATIPGWGTVRFRDAPGDRGTEVTLGLQFEPPGGRFGEAAFRRLGIVPDVIAMKALRRFKSLVETGEIPTLERNPSARGRGDLV